MPRSSSWKMELWVGKGASARAFDCLRNFCVDWDLGWEHGNILGNGNLGTNHDSFSFSAVWLLS
jgi:hypothetical protein